MVRRESSRINLKRENQPRLEYTMPVSSPTKCIACSLDTHRGTLYTIFFTFSCVFVFISTLKDTWSAEKVHESTSNEKISLASNICPVSSPTKCIACSLDTHRGTLYTIFFTFSCVFAFISPPKDGCHVLLLFVLSDCRAVSNGFSGGELFYAGAYVCEKIWIRRMNHPGVSYCRFLRNCAHVGVIPSR
jgi:hypothetical protein